MTTKVFLNTIVRFSQILHQPYLFSGIKKLLQNYTDKVCLCVRSKSGKLIIKLSNVHDID